MTALDIKILKIAAQCLNGCTPDVSILTQDDRAWLVDRFRLGAFPRDVVDISRMVAQVLEAMAGREEMLRMVQEMAARGEFERLADEQDEVRK